MIDPESWVKPQDLSNRIRYLYQLALGTENPLSERQLRRWKNILGINKNFVAPYRGFEYNQLVYFIEGILKTGSLEVTANVIFQLIQEGNEYVYIREKSSRTSERDQESCRTINV